MERSAVNPDAAGPPTAASAVRGPDSVLAPKPGPAGPPAPAPAGPDAPVPLELEPVSLGLEEDAREAWEKALRRNKLVRWIVRWLPHRLTILIRTLLRWEHAIVTRVRHRWRRSLQLRVIATTLAISIIVVAVLGFFLTEQIAGGLLDNAENSARAQALAELNSARSLSGFTARPTNPAAQQFMYNAAAALEPPGSSATSYYVVVGLNDDVKDVYTQWVSESVDSEATLPHAMVASVTADQDKGGQGQASSLLYYAPTTLTFTNGNSSQAAVAVGTPLGNWYQLYFIFPLDNEQQTLQLVQTTLFGAGIALILLLGGIASLVTRWVVVPVRHAAQAARRVSAGHLEERMTVDGADDLGALASSFNEMAGSLQEKLLELEELSKAQRQFVSDVSHELRTPMTTIRMAAEMLHDARDQLDPAAARSAELLQSQTERFEVLLTDLLEISRHDANVATLDPEPTDISDLARRGADDAQHLAERRGCRIEFRLPAEPCVAEVDKRRVDRILRNLLVNAVEHGEGRDVVVTVAADSDAVAVAVRDHGVGLAPGEDQLVFERFWRADPARARTTGGTGLGLAIALEDARLHGGWLQAWGEKGRGAVFRLTVPRLAGRRLVGSPLALGPDETEVVGSALEPDPRA
jgi:two-component system sensor histidine kinase MtrB